MTFPAAASGRSFDPSQAVPEAYDICCEGCGYSLIGLTSNQCPECGRVFDPNALPYARIPWLHRRRLGRIRAYWRTIAMVMFAPRFAAELCRPVRISADDARRFRNLTIWIATICFAQVVIVTPIILGIVMVIVMAPAIIWRSLRPEKELAVFILELLPFALGFHILLRLLTDMPLFIWKGLPSLPATELSPVHRYASAPVAVAGVALLLMGAAWWPLVVVIGPWQEGLVELILPCAAAGLAVSWAAWTWLISLKMMKAAGGATPRRMLLLAIYLPLHWLMMTAMIAMALLALTIGWYSLTRRWF